MTVTHGTQALSVTLTRPTLDERERRMRRFLAIKGCTHCVSCWTPFEAGQPVYREQRYGRDLAPVCEGCKSRYSAHDEGQPCEGCGRLVHNLLNQRHRKRIFCCAKCEVATRSREKHARTVEARGTRECQECGETFEPSRSDAKFCSSACKQKSHRRRITDAVCTPKFTSSSRNGDGA